MAATTIGVAAVVGAGLWLGAGQQPVPIPAAPESAVVVSSLACADGAGGTIVDVLEPMGAPGSGPLRADLDACGYQEGQQLLVQFVPDDRTQVVLAGNESATDFLTGDRLPVALALAGLLALGGLLAVWVNRRRPRDVRWRNMFHGDTDQYDVARPGTASDLGAEPRRPAHQAADREEMIEPDEMIDADGWAGELQLVGHGESAVSGFGDTAVLRPAPPWPAPPRPGRHALPDERAADDAAWDDIIGPATAGPVDQLDDRLSDRSDQGKVSRSLTSVDLTFPFSSSLAACLHDELFTHRTRSS